MIFTSPSDLTRHFWSPRAAGAHPRTTTRPRIRATDRGTQRTPRGNAPAPGRRRAFFLDDDFPLARARARNYRRALLAARCGGTPYARRTPAGPPATPTPTPPDHEASRQHLPARLPHSLPPLPVEVGLEAVLVVRGPRGGWCALSSSWGRHAGARARARGRRPREVAAAPCSAVVLPAHADADPRLSFLSPLVQVTNTV